MKRIIVQALAGCLIVSVFALVSGCGGGEQQQGPVRRPVMVEGAQVGLDSISRTLTTTGEVVALNSVVIASMVDGRIAYCPWREGDSVSADSKLIEIDRALYRADVQTAEAAVASAKAKLADLRAGTRPEEILQAKETVRQLEQCTQFAQRDLERTAKLAESGSVPAELHDKATVSFITCEAKLSAGRERLAMLEAGPTPTAIAVQQAAVQEAEARLSVATARLAESIITAPFSGTVTRVYVRPGDMASPRMPLIQIADMDALVVRFAIPESHAAAVNNGMSLTLNFDAYPSKTFKAEVIRAYPELDRKTRTRKVEAVVSSDVAMVPGMFARIRIEIDKREDVPVIPASAVLVEPSGARVVFVVNDGRAMRREVTVGIEDRDRVEVVNGLEPGEIIAVAGNEGLRNGAEVRVAGVGGGAKPADGGGN